MRFDEGCGEASTWRRPNEATVEGESGYRGVGQARCKGDGAARAHSRIGREVKGKEVALGLAECG